MKIFWTIAGIGFAAAVLLAAFGKRKIAASITIPEDEIKVGRAGPIPLIDNVFGTWIDQLPFSPPGRWQDEV